MQQVIHYTRLNHYFIICFALQLGWTFVQIPMIVKLTTTPKIICHLYIIAYVKTNKMKLDRADSHLSVYSINYFFYEPTLLKVIVTFNGLLEAICHFYVS